VVCVIRLEHCFVPLDAKREIRGDHFLYSPSALYGVPYPVHTHLKARRRVL
jgi:hypothetical protein